MSEPEVEKVEPHEEVVEPEPETADEPEEEPELEPETDEPEEPEAARPPDGSEARMEEIGKKLDGLQKHVARRIGDILEEDAQLFEECELCSYWNTPGWRMKGPYPDEVVTALRHAMGQHAPTDYKKDNYSRLCDDCNGLGQTVSGSKVPQNETLTCIPCKGRGWLPVGPERGGAALVSANGEQTTHPDVAGGAELPVAGAPILSPEVEAAKAQGYIIIPPVGVS